MQRKSVTEQQAPQITLVQDWPEFDDAGKPAVDAAGEPILHEFASVKPKKLSAHERKVFEQRVKEEKVLTFSYYRYAVKLSDILNRPADDDQEAAIRFTAHMLVRRLADWDLMDGMVKVAISFDELVDLPPQLTNAMLEAINADQAPQMPNPQIGSS